MAVDTALGHAIGAHTGVGPCQILARTGTTADSQALALVDVHTAFALVFVTRIALTLGTSWQVDALGMGATGQRSRAAFVHIHALALAVLGKAGCTTTAIATPTADALAIGPTAGRTVVAETRVAAPCILTGAGAATHRCTLLALIGVDAFARAIEHITCSATARVARIHSKAAHTVATAGRLAVATDTGIATRSVLTRRARTAYS